MKKPSKRQHLYYKLGVLRKPSKRDIVSAIEKVIGEVKAHTLICQGPSFHHDHTLVYEATIAATRPAAIFCPPEIYIMENPTYVHSLEICPKT